MSTTLTSPVSSILATGLPDLIERLRSGQTVVQSEDFDVLVGLLTSGDSHVASAASNAIDLFAEAVLKHSKNPTQSMQTMVGHSSFAMRLVLFYGSLDVGGKLQRALWHGDAGFIPALAEELNNPQGDPLRCSYLLSRHLPEAVRNPMFTMCIDEVHEMVARQCMKWLEDPMAPMRHDNEMTINVAMVAGHCGTHPGRQGALALRTLLDHHEPRVVKAASWAYVQVHPYVFRDDASLFVQTRALRNSAEGKRAEGKQLEAMLQNERIFGSWPDSLNDDGRKDWSWFDVLPLGKRIRRYFARR